MKRILLLVLFAVIGISAASCDIDLRKAPKKVQAAFETMFPDALGVEWEKELNLYKADFHLATHEMEAWFEKDGTWKLSKTEILLTEVPAAVMEAAKNYKDGTWKIDDIDLFQQSVGVTDYYRVEFEKAGSERERTAYFDKKGQEIPKP